MCQLSLLLQLPPQQRLPRRVRGNVLVESEQSAATFAMLVTNSVRDPVQAIGHQGFELLDGDGDHRLAANSPTLGAAGVSRTDIVAIGRITLADHRDDLGTPDHHRVEGADGLHMVAPVSEFVNPTGRGIGLHPDAQIVSPPQPERSGRWSVEGQPGPSHRRGRVLSAPQHSGQDLQEDLGLGIAAHGPRQVGKRPVGSGGQHG